MIEAFTNPCILFQFDPNDGENVDKWLNGEDVHEIETNWVHMGKNCTLKIISIFCFLELEEIEKEKAKADAESKKKQEKDDDGEDEYVDIVTKEYQKERCF